MQPAVYKLFINIRGVNMGYVKSAWDSGVWVKKVPGLFNQELPPGSFLLVLINQFIENSIRQLLKQR